MSTAAPSAANMGSRRSTARASPWVQIWVTAPSPAAVTWASPRMRVQQASRTPASRSAGERASSSAALRGESAPEACTRHLRHRPLPPQGMSGRWPLRSRASDSSSPASTSTGRARPSAQIVRHAMGYPSLKKTAPK